MKTKEKPAARGNINLKPEKPDYKAELDRGYSDSQFTINFTPIVKSMAFRKNAEVRSFWRNAW